MVDPSKHFKQYNRSDIQAVNDEFKLTEYQYEIFTLIEKLKKLNQTIFDGPVIVDGGTITFDGADNILISTFGAVDVNGSVIINDNTDVEIDTWLDTGEGVANYIIIAKAIVDDAASERAARHTSIDWFPVVEEQALITLSLAAPDLATTVCLGYVVMESGNPVYYPQIVLNSIYRGLIFKYYFSKNIIWREDIPPRPCKYCRHLMPKLKTSN